MRFGCVALALVLTLGQALALESDQYLVSTIELPDLRESLNTHVNGLVNKHIQLANEKMMGPASCQAIQKKIVKEFRGFIIHKIEHWLETEHGQEIFPSVDVSYPRYYQSSLYGWKYGFISRFFPLGRNLQIGNVQIGQDKLAHFFSTGYRYYVKYKKLKKKGMNDDLAVKKIIDYGIGMENTYLGLWPAGIFSFGDLEANYQGFLFYRNFCEGEKPMLSYHDGQWTQRAAVDMGQHINPYMNEVFNPSYFGFWRWSKIKNNLKERCTIFEEKNVITRLQEWEKSVEPSYSVGYINQLQIQGDKSVPSLEKMQSQNICGR